MRFQVLEKLMYDKLHNYLITNKKFFSKQVEFWDGYLTDDTTVELMEEIANGFIETEYTLDVFIDLSKLFVM